MARDMIITTTPQIEGRRIVAYHGIVSGEAILGANVFRDFFASIRDVVGGRAGSYERVLRDGRDTALQEMIEEMAESDLKTATRLAFLKRHGYSEPEPRIAI